MERMEVRASADEKDGRKGKNGEEKGEAGSPV